MGIKKNIIGVAVVVVGVSFNVFAQQKGNLSSSPFFSQLPEKMEKATIETEENLLKKAKLYIEYAKRRLEEFKISAAKGDTNEVKKLAGDYQDSIMKGIEAINQARIKREDVGDTLKIVENVLQESTKILDKLINNVPLEIGLVVSQLQEVIDSLREQISIEINTIQKEENEGCSSCAGR
ncbi:MAG: hypothetical protein B6D55_02700 [Candidatus Omnitrophica bacterium 4484_70.2]|nr:MAG: hypothetical protein B6D55_02700 [Candidatus Omnitrophica bacterium 4484_70.2]